MEENRKKFLREAKTYTDMRDELGRDRLENFKFLKGQTADWYIAIAAVCFAIGGISISLAGDSVKHPALFWWGSVLLIVNGVVIFFARKTELEGEFSMLPGLEQTEADLWTMSKIAKEYAEGDHGREKEFVDTYKRFSNDYEKRLTPLNWWRWIMFVARACMLDVVFGLLLFPILLLASQLPNYMHITFKQYSYILWVSLTLYMAYMIFGIIKAIKQKHKSDSAKRQVKREVGPKKV